MINEISNYIKQSLNYDSEEDSIIFNGSLFRVNKSNYKGIISTEENESLAFIDGGQAEILVAANFCLSFIRVAAVIFENGNKRTMKNEFFLFTRAEYQNNEIYYKSKIFTNNERLVDEEDLSISSNDSSIKTGSQRAPISKVVNMARRFAELSFAPQIKSDFIILDGTLEKTFKNEEKYLLKLSNNCCALAKSSSLFTSSGNNPTVLLNKLGDEGCWNYCLNEKTSFVKLHEKAKHVFRFEGNKEVLDHLIANSKGALFLGYPYGLVLVDKIARVSNQEKSSLKMKFLLCEQNKQLFNYLQTSDAHNILDNLG